MTTNKRLAQRFYAAFNDCDAAAFRQVLSPIWIDHPVIPGRQPGPDELVAIVGAFKSAFEGLILTPEHIVAEADHVAVRIRMEGRHVGEWAGYPASGRSVVFHGLDMHRVEADHIVETWHFEDYGSLR